MKPLVEWKPEYRIGVEAIDLQHEYFADLINRLAGELDNARNESHRMHLIDELVRYALFHFRSEENFMFSAGYPGLERHAVEHLMLIDKLTAEVTLSSRKRPTAHALQFLVEWFVDHTTGTDRDFAAFLNEPES